MQTLQTYIALSSLLLKVSLLLGLLASLCLLVTRLRKPADPPEPSALYWQIPLMLACVAVHLVLGNWLWQAAQTGAIVSCGDNGCFGSSVPLAEPLMFWGTAVIYWLGFVIAPVVYLLPPLRWLMQAWQNRGATTQFLDTEPAQ